MNLGDVVGESKMGFDELEFAVRIVQLASFLCQTVQEKLMAMDDNSLVTVTDWSVKAIVSWILSKHFGNENISIVASEETWSLREDLVEGVLSSVVETVNECLCEASRFGLEVPKMALGRKDVLEAISRCNSVGGARGRFWTVSSVDSTLGFVRGDLYAVGLALIEDGEVALGVLGCPNYPMKKEWLNYHYRYYRLVCKLTPLAADSCHCILYARRGSGEAWMQPLVYKDKLYSWSNSARRVHASSLVDPAMATLCETVERVNTSHSFTAGLAQSAGIRRQSLRVYGMVKYAAIAIGDAEVFMKFTRTGYREKIWDHAAGVVIIQEAGGVVTDVGGNPLDFSSCLNLEGLDRGIIACANAEMHYRLVQAFDASYASSCL